MADRYIAANRRVNYRTVGGTMETRRQGEVIDNIDPDNAKPKVAAGVIVEEDEWERRRSARVAEQQPFRRPTLEFQSEPPQSQVELDLATVARMSVRQIEDAVGQDDNRRRQVVALERQRPEDQQRKTVLELDPDS